MWCVYGRLHVCMCGWMWKYSVFKCITCCRTVTIWIENTDSIFYLLIWVCMCNMDAAFLERKWCILFLYIASSVQECHNRYTCFFLWYDRADEEPVDQKKYLEESCKPKCVKSLLEYQVIDHHYHLLFLQLSSQCLPYLTILEMIKPFRLSVIYVHFLLFVMVNLIRLKRLLQ